MERMVKQVDGMAMFSAERSDFAAALFADCEHLSFDSEGRITLSENLLNHARIQDRVAFVGCGSTFQMWEPEAFTQQKNLARSRFQQEGITLPFHAFGGA